MPWKSNSDVSRHNKAAGKSKRKGRVWLEVANKTLKRTGNEGRAIREANAVAGRMYGGKK